MKSGPDTKCNIPYNSAGQEIRTRVEQLHGCRCLVGARTIPSSHYILVSYEADYALKSKQSPAPESYVVMEA